MTFTVHQAKTHLSRLLQKAADGEEVVIARGTTPIAKLVPIGTVAGKRPLGSMEGVFKVGPEFFEPLPEEEMALWE